MELTPIQLGLVPVVLGVVSVLKMSGLSSRYAPVASLLLGVLAVCGLAMAITTLNIIIGLVVGLSASGLYSGGKAILK